MHKFQLFMAVATLLLGSVPSVWAQAGGTPTTEQMIEQLKAPPLAPRTRSLRNLTVEAASDANTTGAATAANGATATAAPVVRPSLSLMIQFDFNSAQIRPESQQALLNLAGALKAAELASSNFAVEGHTDAKGLPDYNLKLSQQRADAVQQFLVSRGVASTRLVASGKGATQLANGANPLGAENRRVRIVNLE
jgi:outer membrane protein OmpA-like peptidoglycan-associated protein